MISEEANSITEIASETSVEAPAPAKADWNIATRITFRFLFCYFGLYIFNILANTATSLLPWLRYPIQAYQNVWERVVPWVGVHILHLDHPAKRVIPSGSGDQTFNWVQVFCYLALAVLGTILWSVLDRKRKEYRRLHSGFIIAIRYAVALTMINYGMVKLIKLQMPSPTLERLVEPYGDFSPMGVLWQFMGTSTAYEFFGGAGEMLGSLLLFFPKTALLGALVTAGVMLNVVVMNFCYDTPVKLLSSHLVLMCIFIIAPDLKRLAGFFVFNRPVPPAHDLLPMFPARWVKWASVALKTVVIGFALYNHTMSSIQQQYTRGLKAPKPDLFGIWEVEEFKRNGEALPPLTTDSIRWRKVIIGGTNRLTLRMMNDATRGFAADYKVKEKTIELTDNQDKAKSTFKFNRPDFEHLTVEGTFNGDTVAAKMRRVDETKMLLLSRGFHWISEVGMNR
jgi:hypothetical protein